MKNKAKKVISWTNENFLHHCLDADAVPFENYLDDNRWVTGERSNSLIEEALNKAQVDAGLRCNSDKNKSVSRFILHPKLTNPIPRSETSLEFKLARKMSKRSKKDISEDCEIRWRLGASVFVHHSQLRLLKHPDFPKSK